MTSQMIKRYKIEGQTDNTRLLDKQDEYRRTITGMMRDEGFVPLLDLDPVFSWNWVKDELYEFTYTWQAVYVGEEEAWQTEGVLAGKRIPSTRTPK